MLLGWGNGASGLTAGRYRVERLTPDPAHPDEGPGVLVVGRVTTVTFGGLPQPVSVSAVPPGLPVHLVPL